MKVRSGFVSNSSTTSFLCDICGHLEAERDLCITDAEMLQCRNGHTLCISHMKEGNPIDIPRSTEEKKQILLKSGFADSVKELEDGDIDGLDDLYDDWKSEAHYEIPPEMCPFCCLNQVTDELLLLYMFKTLETTRDEVVEIIRKKYTTCKDLETDVKQK